MCRILLLGDVIQDWNLMEYPPAPSHAYHSLPKTIQIEAPGGVRYLRDLIKGVVPVQDNDIQCPGDTRKENAVRVFNAWKSFSKATKDTKNKVWRIDRIIGRSEPGVGNVDMVGNDVKGAKKADLLVIDHLGLGWLEAFMSNEVSLAEELMKKAQPDQIILKMSSLKEGLPFGTARDRLDKLTVVLSAHTLRDRGAAISEGLSWDRTIEDTVREFDGGLSQFDLALCRRVVVLFSAEGAALFERANDSPTVRLRKFLYRPSCYEGSIKSSHPGQMSGNLSFVTAAVIRHLALGMRYPFFVALSLSLAAIRKQYEEGIKENEKATDRETRFDFEKHRESLCEVLTLTDCLSDGTVGKGEKEKVEKQKGELNKHLGMFSCAFSHDLLEYPPHKEGAIVPDRTPQMPWASNLLRDVTGYGYEYVAARAFQIVMQGTEKAMSHMPIASYGEFLTADREEIERINAIRKLIIAYRENLQDKRPLSLAVFGPPGSGKSFSIKQLAAELGFADKSIHTFNLSEFKEPSELHVAFHIVRDATIQGKIPLIFWDEFDSDSLKWLKEFLAPMQDAEFRAGSIIHPLGKAIFIFAGGVFCTFEEFEEKTCGEREKKVDQSRKEDMVSSAHQNSAKRVMPPNPYDGRKAPDFISRLRGYVNIKGPNPQERGDDNHEYLIRRAILLRSVLKRFCGHLLGDKGQMAVSAPVVQAFLRVGKYKHGARSLESIIAMSDLVRAPFFGEAALPPDHLLDLHVNAEAFRKLMKQAAIDMPMMEMIAESCHRGWRKQKKDEGYEYGPVRSDIPPKRHPLLVEYLELDESGKEGNRLSAWVTPAKLKEAGLEIVYPSAGQTEPGIDEFKKKKEHLMRIEHDVWMRDHLLAGYELAEETVDALRLHRCVRRFEFLDDVDKKLDYAIVESLQETLEAKGYGVTKAVAQPTGADEEKKSS
jgi:hypothetical protein